MKKIQVKQIIICVSVVFLVVIFFLAVTIGIKLKAMHTENDTYIEYTCRDFHLVALEQGDCVGYKDICIDFLWDRNRGLVGFTTITADPKMIDE